MLAGSAEEEEPIFFVLSKSSLGDATVLCDLSQIRSIVESSISVGVMVQKVTEEAGKAI